MISWTSPESAEAESVEAESVEAELLVEPAEVSAVELPHPARQDRTIAADKTVANTRFNFITISSFICFPLIYGTGNVDKQTITNPYPDSIIIIA